MNLKKSKFSHTIVSERFTRLFALLIIVIGLVVLLGWYSGLMFLTRFSVNEVPMAPSTAYVFIFLAVGLWFYLRPQKIAINRNTAIASAVIVICLSCLLIITTIFKYYANWEHAFIKLPETHLSMKIGHMSLVTALLFIISGFAFLFLLSNRKIIKTFSIILTLIIFIISFILLLGYGFGTPFFYFDNFIPPAVLTVLSFLLNSLGLIAASDKNTFFVKTIWKTSTSAKLLRIFLPTTIGIIIIESLITIRILPLLNIHPAIGVSLVSLIVVAVVIVVISIISKSMGEALDSALENLNESEDKFRTLVANIPGVTYRCGYEKDWPMHFLSDQIKDLSGYPAADFVSRQIRSYASIIHADDRKKVENSIFSAVEKKEPFQIEYRINHANEEIRWIYENGQAIFDENDNVSCLDGVLIDITGLKSTDKALKESEEKYRQLILNSPDLIAVQGVDGTAKFVSLQSIEVLGVTPEVIHTMNIFEHIHAEDVEKAQTALQEAIAGNEIRHCEYRFIDPDGKRDSSQRTLSQN
jgi:PAS domain S-box-containing protein